MFSWIKKLFNRKYEVLIPISNEIYANKKLLCFEDLYNKAGVMTYIEDMISKSPQKRFHYQNIQANEYTCKRLDKTLRDHLLNTKNKFSKAYKSHVLANMSAMDCLTWSPKVVNDLPNDVIRVILPGHTEFVEVTKEMLI